MKNRMPSGRWSKLCLGVVVAIVAVASALGAQPASGRQSAEYEQVAAQAQAMQTSLDSGDFFAIGINRHALAEVVAPFAGVAASELEDAWAVADPRRQTAVYTALAQLGLPYVTNGESTTSGFDCSGLTKYAWGQAGVELEHQSEAQVGQGERRSFTSALPGDLLHYPGHIGLSLGVGRSLVHAVNHQTGLAIGEASAQTLDVIAPIS